MSHPLLKTLISEMAETYINKSAFLTNSEARKIEKEAKKMAEKVRKSGGPLADKDASYLEMLASDAFSKNLKSINMTMNGGETENREQVFAVVSKVIGKERAQHLAKGNY